MNLRCYCCGAPLAERFALVTYVRDADRVFVMLPEHVARVEHGQSVIVKLDQPGKPA